MKVPGNLMLTSNIGVHQIWATKLACLQDRKEWHPEINPWGFVSVLSLQYSEVGLAPDILRLLVLNSKLSPARSRAFECQRAPKGQRLESGPAMKRPFSEPKKIATSPEKTSQNQNSEPMMMRLRPQWSPIGFSRYWCKDQLSKSKSISL